MTPVPDKPAPVEPVPTAPAPAGAPVAAEEPGGLANFLINVILPVMVLDWMSKEDGKPWNVGPGWALVISVALPVVYGLWFFARTRRTNVISLVGMVSVLLTGGIAWAAWRPDGSVDPSLFKIYAFKEALVPSTIGLCVLVSQRSATPLVRMLIFNDQVFHLARINGALDARSTHKDLDRLLWQAALVLAGSFFLSGLFSFLMALYFLGGLDSTALNARELYNKAISRQTFWGFVVIGLPFILVIAALFRYLLKRLESFTGLTREELTSAD